MMYVFCLWFVCHIVAALTVCYVAKMSKLHRIISEHNVVDNKPSPHTFSVPIQETPMWKIQAVAKYKLSRHQRKRGRNSDMYIPKQVSQRPEYSEQYEMALDRRSHEIRKEMTAMNSARISLMWLLKKTTEYETKRNHVVAQGDGSQQV